MGYNFQAQCFHDSACIQVVPSAQNALSPLVHLALLHILQDSVYLVFCEPLPDLSLFSPSPILHKHSTDPQRDAGHMAGMCYNFIYGSDRKPWSHI